MNQDMLAVATRIIMFSQINGLLVENVAFSDVGGTFTVTKDETTVYVKTLVPPEGTDEEAMFRNVRITFETDKFGGDLESFRNSGVGSDKLRAQLVLAVEMAGNALFTNFL